MTNREMRLIKEELAGRKAQPHIGPDVVSQIFYGWPDNRSGRSETRTYVGVQVEHLPPYQAGRILADLQHEAME
ncbi:hypothetical protein [Bradyrhizobium sp.]